MARKKRKTRELPLQDGMTPTESLDEVMAMIEAALNDADIESVWLSHTLHAEMLADPEDPGDPDLWQALPAGVPGRVMVMLYNRRQSNVRIFPLDEEGLAYADAFMRNPNWHELMPTVFAQDGLDA